MRKRKEREEAEKKKLAGPDVPEVTLLNFMDHEFGQLFIQSHCTTDRKVGHGTGPSAHIHTQRRTPGGASPTDVCAHARWHSELHLREAAPICILLPESRGV